jgi:ribosomal protein S18 acetylase RimI-like enzyme
MLLPLHIQPLDPARHDRARFDCGVAELNDYLAKTANQDVKRNAAGCWVAVASEDSDEILGYYTLAPEGIAAADLPELPPKILKKLPRYPRFGAALLGRLAVSQSLQGLRLGERLLFDALTRCLASEIPFVMVVVDPKDEKAAAWYARFGFRVLTGDRMFVTVEELKTYFQSSE